MAVSPSSAGTKTPSQRGQSGQPRPEPDARTQAPYVIRPTVRTAAVKANHPALRVAESVRNAIIGESRIQWPPARGGSPALELVMGHEHEKRDEQPWRQRPNYLQRPGAQHTARWVRRDAHPEGGNDDSALRQENDRGHEPEKRAGHRRLLQPFIPRDQPSHGT